MALFTIAVVGLLFIIALFTLLYVAADKLEKSSKSYKKGK